MSYEVNEPILNSPFDEPSRFPEEVKEGFTVKEWQPFNVTVEEVKPDKKKELN
jgi:hypothetical protein